MKILLTPAIRLMQRLRLLPKFMLVCLVFLLPLALATTLLISELGKSLAQAQDAQRGVAYVRQLQEATRLLHQGRASRPRWRPWRACRPARACRRRPN